MRYFAVLLCSFAVIYTAPFASAQGSVSDSEIGEPDEIPAKVIPSMDGDDAVNADSAPTRAASTPKPAAHDEGMTVIMKLKAKAGPSSSAPEKKIAAKVTKAAKKTKTAKAETVTKAHDAETILQWLRNGNLRFEKKHFRADGKNPEDRKRVAAGEHPHAIIIASSDSRVVPEFIFDQGLGEIYTIRSFGESLDSSTIAAAEYAVEKLRVPLLVVMGNSDCAAIKAMASEKVNENGDQVGDVTLSGEMEKVLAAISPRLKSIQNEPASSGFEVEATLNADGIARELVRRSEVIHHAVESGKLKIKSALYRLNTGKVSFY